MAEGRVGTGLVRSRVVGWQDLNLHLINLRAGTKAIAYVRQVWGKAVALLRFEPPTVASCVPIEINSEI
jgi:hypothetical protein